MIKLYKTGYFGIVSKSFLMINPHDQLIIMLFLGHVLVLNDSTTKSTECNGEWSKKPYWDCIKDINNILKLT